MPPEPVHTASCIIRCPTCAKAMLLKHWKHHRRQMHTMSETAIEKKYMEYQQNFGQPKSKKSTLYTSKSVEKPCPLTTNSMFQIKKINSIIQIYLHHSQLIVYRSILVMVD
jgi:hypothetical protein